MAQCLFKSCRKLPDGDRVSHGRQWCCLRTLNERWCHSRTRRCLLLSCWLMQLPADIVGCCSFFYSYNGATALVGAVLCFVAMLLIDEFWAVIALIIAVVIFVVITASDPPTNWGSAPEAIQSMRIMQVRDTFPRLHAVCHRTIPNSSKKLRFMKASFDPLAIA